MTITFIVYNGGFPYITEAKTDTIDFHGAYATFTDADGNEITIEKDDMLSVEQA